MAPGNPALDMSLDDLIKKARKPAAKKPAAAGAAKKKPAPAAAAAKGGQKQGQQKKPVAGGAKGKLQQQKQQQPQQKQQLGLKAKGGIQKAGGGGAVRPAPGKVRVDSRFLVYLYEYSTPPGPAQNCALRGSHRSPIPHPALIRYRVSASATGSGWPEAR